MHRYRLKNLEVRLLPAILERLSVPANPERPSHLGTLERRHIPAIPHTLALLSNPEHLYILANRRIPAALRIPENQSNPDYLYILEDLCLHRLLDCPYNPDFLYRLGCLDFLVILGFLGNLEGPGSLTLLGFLGDLESLERLTALEGLELQAAL